MYYDLMYSIEISSCNHMQMLEFLSDYGVDIDRYMIHIDTNNDSKLIPSVGMHKIKYNDDEYEIDYLEEGQPVTGSRFPEYYKRLVIRNTDLNKLKTFVTKALTYNKPLEKQKIRIYYGKSQGYWDSFDSVYAQSMDKIFIDPDTKKGIVDHIDTFIKMHAKYVKYGRPYKLNLLLTGVPGSGKSSIVKALALKYNRPLYITGFSKGLTDESIIDLISNVKDNSILLFEDIDAFFIDRKPVDINLSFSCLINILDGALNKGNGIITILTANKPEDLDPAMIRPGRIDRIIKFDYPKKSEIEAVFRDLVGEDANFEIFYQKIKNQKINMSGIVDYLFRHGEDYIEQIDELLNNTTLIQEITNDKTNKLYS